MSNETNETIADIVSYTAEDTKAIRDSRLPGVMFSDYNKREARLRSEKKGFMIFPEQKGGAK